MNNQYSERPNNIPLPSLPLPRKLALTISMLLGLILFLGAWAAVIAQVYWDLDNGTIGSALGMLAMRDGERYSSLLILHIVSTLLLLVPSIYLFAKTSLRRRVRALLKYSVAALVVLDLSAWLYAPSCSETNLYVGIVGGFAAIALTIYALVPVVQMWWYQRWNPQDGETKRVVIVGGGFGGLYAALGLNRVLGYHPKLEIAVLDQNNYFLFPPLLPSAATGTIEHRQVSYPFRRIFETTNIRFIKMKVASIDPHSKTVHGQAGEAGEVTQLPFDVLVFSPGSVSQTFNTKGAAEHAFFMRELEDAMSLRDRIIDSFEQAAACDTRSIREALLHFVVVGAGPTGIETATEIIDLITHVLLKRYPEIPAELPRVTIVQSGGKVLQGWDEGIVKKVSTQLNRLGIALRLGSRVREISPQGVTLEDGSTLHAHTVIWSAGVKPSPLVEASGLNIEKSGKIAVRHTLQSMDFDTIFVVGDVAHLVLPGSNTPLPALAQVAFQQGKFAAQNIVRLLSGKPLKNFSYFDYGSLVSVGEHYAAVKLMGLRLTGVVAWFIWRSLYLAKLPGIGNRIRVMLDWTLDLLLERSITQTRASSRESRITAVGNEKLSPHDEFVKTYLPPMLPAGSIHLR